MSNTTLVVVIIIAVVVLAAIAVVAYRAVQKKQSERLRDQFGPEYERTLQRSGDQREAESELRGRTERHKELELRTLDTGERDGFQRRWTDVQGEFVDDPSRAVRDADQLVVEVMSARGYPVDDFDQRADDLSVQHPVVTQHYRDARRIATANEKGSADTEELRRAVTSYRSLVEALLKGDDDAGRSDRGDRDRETREGQAWDGHTRDGEAPDSHARRGAARRGAAGHDQSRDDEDRDDEDHGRHDAGDRNSSSRLTERETN